MEEAARADEPGSPAQPRRRHRVVLGVAVVLVAVLLGYVVVRWVTGSAREVDPADVTTSAGIELDAEPAVLRPPQGVYVYEGSGTDRIDRPPRSQAQGPTMPATVTHHGTGCWTFRIDYSTNHWQSWEYCPDDDGGMGEAGGQSFQRWDFGAFANETTSSFECDAAPTVVPGAEPGDEWDHTCSGTSTGVDGTTTSEGPYRFVGVEDLDIGTEVVEAARYRRERTNSGNQTGVETSEVWFSVATGMPLRNERRLEATSSTVIGEVTYTEEGEFQLTSTEPQR